MGRGLASKTIENSVNARLRNWRIDKGVTLDDLSERAEVSKSTLSGWEKGDNGMHYEWSRHREAVQRICHVLDVEPDTIWFGAAPSHVTDRDPTLSMCWYGGMVPCVLSEYLANVDLETGAQMYTKQIVVQLRESMRPHVEVQLDVRGLSMAPRLLEGDIAQCRRATVPVDGMLHVVLYRADWSEEMVVGIWGLVFRGDHWWRTDANGVLYAFQLEDGPDRVLALVTVIETRDDDGGFTRECKPNGIPIHPRPRSSGGPN